MTSTPVTNHPAAASAVALSALDQAVMIASRRERNFAPQQITVTLHTMEGALSLQGRAHGHTIPAPGFPELPLPTYTFPTTDLETFLTQFTQALDAQTTRASRLVLAVHADVPGYDFDDAYAWSYDPQTKDFQAVLPADAADLFHEETTLLAYRWHKAPYSSVSALAPADPTKTGPTA
ncbi:hypothetical protein [Streptomyces botrytidirepellens]|uniref:Uncharacterized protein n=1 Tax=Streptomyces botrytidirepellens TaxID=2486417 RepID=A0A3M8WF58_9ACTN|nr:hypothetical protein [Streptomyces botrytidirepellens]RNG28738.1 hypothetical protein EEJ42_12035 [Streptomyces botrytidirepellens]